MPSPLHWPLPWLRLRWSRWSLWFLSGFGALALTACSSGEGGTAGNTELNVIVPTNAGTPNEVDIQTVEYTMTCAGNSDAFLDNGVSFADQVRIEGNLEVVDGRTDPQGAIPPEFGTARPGDGAEVWQGFMDLPPGPCNIELRARDNDGEVICTAIEPFVITADTIAKVNLVLICDVSFQAPVGTLDVDATFSFNVGNFCPDLFILNCHDSNPVERQVLPPPNPPLAVTGCEVRFRDGDSSCGASCDPQSCAPTATGLACTPGPDPGVSTTITCNAAALLDCQGDGVPDAECVISGDTLGTLPELLDGVIPCATNAACFAATGDSNATCNAGFCDFSNSNPNLNASFFVACVPPALGGLPGAVVECAAVTTDGDLDCDKTKLVNVHCVGIDVCTQYGMDEGFPDGDQACQAAAGTVCLASVCDEALAVGGSCAGGICCVATNAADGADCSAELPPVAECQGGVCNSTECTSDAECDDGNECTTDLCNFGTGLCDNVGAPNDGNLCLLTGCPPFGDEGTCGSGSCVPNDTCAVDGDCPNTPAPPADAQCTAAVCNNQAGCGSFCEVDLAPNVGGSCDFIFPGLDDGTCHPSGECFSTGPPDCGTTTATVQLGCTNGVTSAQSPFPNQLAVSINEGLFGGAPFTAYASGLGAFPKFFLDAAQSTVPGGVRSAIVEGFNATVEANNGSGQILLQADPSGITPGLLQFCTYPSSTVCTADSDCIVAPCNPPVLVANVPIAEDCGPGGVCEGLGQGFADGPAAQCNITDPPEFCVISDLLIPLYAPGGPQVMTAGASGEVVFNWAVDPATITCPDPTTQAPACMNDGLGGGTGTIPDGAYILPPSIYGDPVNNPASVGLNGIRLNVAGALFVALQCSGSQDGGACSVTTTTGCLVDGDCPAAETCIGVGVDDDIIMPTDLSSVPTRCFIH